MKSQLKEASSAQEETQDAIRDRESLERRIESLDSQLREAWEARDLAVAESKHANRDMKESKRGEAEAARSRDKAHMLSYNRPLKTKEGCRRRSKRCSVIMTLLTVKLMSLPLQ